MRTGSFKSRVAELLEKVTLARQHLEEATDAAEALPSEESQEIQDVLSPS